MAEHNGKGHKAPKVRCAQGLEGSSQTDRSQMNVQDILDFAQSADLEDVRELIERQIRCNTAISQEGLRHPWGAQVGRTMMKAENADVFVRAAAAAAAGSDARMSGCELPVAIVSGSGNQGMAVSLPVIAYADELNATREQTYRALALANLIALLQKRYIGEFVGPFAGRCAPPWARFAALHSCTAQTRRSWAR